MVILKLILKEQGWRVSTGFIWTGRDAGNIIANLLVLERAVNFMTS
jgi:hypothetical protein